MPARSCCQLTELLGIFYSSRGRVIRSGDGQAAYFPLLRNPVARKVVRLVHLLGRMEVKYQASRSAKQMTFTVELTLPDHLREHFELASSRFVVESACDRKALVRGVFLGCGSVNAPSARYHLEFVLPTAGWAAVVTGLLAAHEIRAGISERQGHHLVYLKDGDGIARTLSLMGASRAVMEFENMRVVREVSGQVNRRINFETANIDKTIESALRQVAAIEALERSGRLGMLSPALQEVARARRGNPDMNLTELALQMRLSKSAVNHRLRRLVELAEVAPPPGLDGAGARREPAGVV
jgi:DNA-binding protein WhiA